MFYRDPNSKEPPPPEILARWARGGWLFKPPGHGWTRCHQQLPEDAPDAALFAAARRMFGHQGTKGGWIARRDDGERMPNPPVAGPHLLWHYTTAVALPAILEAGELRPAGEARGEHPAVWFTTRGDWETGASMGVYRIPGFGEVRELEAGLRAEHGDAVGDAFLLAVARVLAPWFVAGLVRIGIGPCAAPYTWDDFKRVSGGPDASWADVEADDLRRGCDNREWRVSFEPVPASLWVAVEVRSGVGPGERWEPINPTCWRGET